MDDVAQKCCTFEQSILYWAILHFDFGNSACTYWMQFTVLSELVVKHRHLNLSLSKIFIHGCEQNGSISKCLTLLNLLKNELNQNYVQSTKVCYRQKPLSNICSAAFKYADIKPGTSAVTQVDVSDFFLLQNWFFYLFKKESWNDNLDRLTTL